jgi:hypothetical protein
MISDFFTATVVLDFENFMEYHKNSNIENFEL